MADVGVSDFASEAGFLEVVAATVAENGGPEAFSVCGHATRVKRAGFHFIA